MIDRLNIGLMGGTFDPVHHGHLFAAEAAREAFMLNKVLFLPTGSPPHKRDRDISAAAHRIKMLELAIARNPYFEVCSVETDRVGMTYTVDTLEQLTRESPLANFYFIIGADTLMEIGGWKSFHEVAVLCRFIVIHRPGILPAAALKEAERLKVDVQARIEFLESLHLQISSMDIRNRVLEERSIRYIVPEAVLSYIQAFHLYRGSSFENTRR